MQPGAVGAGGLWAGSAWLACWLGFGWLFLGFGLIWLDCGWIWFDFGLIRLGLRWIWLDLAWIVVHYSSNSSHSSLGSPRKSKEGLTYAWTIL